MNKFSLLIVPVIALFSSSPAQSKTFATINGKVVTCEQAYKFRDGPLYRSYEMLFSDTEAKREARRQKTILELKGHIEKLRAQWNSETDDTKRKIYVSLASLVLAEFIGRSGKDAINNPALDATTKKYAELAVERSAALGATLLSAGLKNPPSAESIASLPFGTLAMAVPQLRTASKIYEYGVLGIEYGSLLAELYVTDIDYRGQIIQLERAVIDILSRTTKVQLQHINKIKADIDKACS